ncbi:MAG: histidine kinase [Acidobacteriota bacterium]
MARTGKSSKFWIVYLAAWLPYAASYAAVFLAQGSASLGAVIRGTLINIGSAALLGLGVLRICEQFTWTHHRRPWFFPAHTGFIAAYSTLWLLAMMTIATIEQSVIAGRWSPVIFARPVIYWTLLSGLMIYATIASVAYVIQVSSRLREEQARAERLEALRAMAELKALRAQLNPHFLFNTLHSLMALVRHNPQAAEDALERFADMLRYTLKAGREDKAKTDDVLLIDEWNFVQNYLSMEKLRLGDRLRVETSIDANSLDCSVPAFILQPLVENAIRHAIAPHMRSGTVMIASRIEDGELVLEVSDDGPGTTKDEIETSSGLGLRAARQRLELRYGGQARFDIDAAPRKGVAIKIRVPVEHRIEDELKDREVQWQLAP